MTITNVHIRQTPFVAILTHDITRTVHKMQKFFMKFNHSTLSGRLQTGEEFKIFRCETPSDVLHFTGYKFSRIVIHGKPHPDLVNHAYMLTSNPNPEKMVFKV